MSRADRPVAKMWRPKSDISQVACLTCGDRGSETDPGWARRHAEKHPGHQTVIDRTSTTCFLVKT